MKLKLALLTAAVALLATAALAFAAKHVDSKTSLALGPQPGKFSGVVTADDPKCVSGRKVIVYRVVPEPKEKVAKDFSDINGIWKRQTDEQSGSWFAKLKPERRGGLYCEGDKSPERSAG
jgi:hypothetical protein